MTFCLSIYLYFLSIISSFTYIHIEKEKMQLHIFENLLMYVVG